MLQSRPNRLAKVGVSVVIPCASKHAPILPSLIGEFEKQTSPPEEIVISISGTETPPLLTSKKIRVVVLSSATPSNASVNRNRATARARGDLFVYQDADDVPHPQRIEIVRALFARFEFDHLLHQFTPQGGASWSASRYDPPFERLAYYRVKYQFEYGTTNGNPVLSRQTALRFRWPENVNLGEDVRFNCDVYAQAKKKVILRAPLLFYRRYLSAGTPR